jgi:hypothetical protein
MHNSDPDPESRQRRVALPKRRQQTPGQRLDLGRGGPVFRFDDNASPGFIGDSAGGGQGARERLSERALHRSNPLQLHATCF